MIKIWRLDLVSVLRALRREPTYAISASLAVALGVAGATIVASVAAGVLIRDDGYREADRLVLITARDPARGTTSVAPSIGDYLDLRERTRSFSDLASFVTLPYNLPGGGTEPALPIEVNFASASLLSMLGVQPVRGRSFVHLEEKPGADLHTVVISYDLWQRRFGGEADVVGRRILLDTTQYEVIGVMPPGFRFGYRFAANADAWAPLESWLARYGTTMGEQPRGARAYYNVLGRLAAGVSMDEAADELSRVGRELAQTYPTTNRDVSFSLSDLRESQAGPLKPYLTQAAAAVALLLAMACATVAGLMLVRAGARRAELATRLALGASRRDLVRQWLLEGVLLGLGGATLGVVVAAQAVRAIDAAVPVTRPVWMVFAVDWQVAGIAVLLGVVTGLLFGLLPAWAASRVGVGDALRAEGRSAMSHTDKARRWVVTGQVALAFVLLTFGLGLLRSLLQLQTTPIGVQPTRLLAAYVSPPGDKFRAGEHLPAYADLYLETLERLRSLPEVEAAGGMNVLPFDGENMPDSGVVVTLEGETLESQRNSPSVLLVRVSGDAFDVAGVPLLEGRAFREDETLQRPRVAVVSRSMARHYWPERNPIGQRVRIGPASETGPWHTVVGVVDDVRYHGAGREAPLVLYRPFTQAVAGSMHYLVRTRSTEAATMADLVSRTVGAVDSDVAVYWVRELTMMLGNARWQERLWTLICGVFGGSAWLLAMLGVYGVTATSVQQRQRAFGVRVALGARPWDIVRLVQSEVARLLAVGISLGLGGALLLTPVTQSVLAPGAARDGLTFALVATTLALSSLVAGWYPSRRAARSKPALSLR